MYIHGLGAGLQPLSCVKVLPVLLGRQQVQSGFNKDPGSPGSQLLGSRVRQSTWRPHVASLGIRDHNIGNYIVCIVLTVTV